MMSVGIPYRLLRCVWEITLACCFKCAHCGSKAGRARVDELTTGECLSVVDQLAELGCERVSFIGGEVFMRDDWDIVAFALAQRGIRCSIITNGYMINDETIVKLGRADIESVAVSIDGTREIHDAQRTQGSLDRALDSIRLLVDSGVPASVITTLHPESVSCLEDLYDVLCELGISAWQLQACSPMGNAACRASEARIDAREVIQFVERHAKEATFMLGVADNIGYHTSAEGWIRGDMSGKSCFRGCMAGLASIGIDSIGNVRGCESMYADDFIEGNLREASLRSIWEDPDAFSYNRGFTSEMLTGACAGCAVGIYCAGGCRSYNYFMHGKMYESPNCARCEPNNTLKL